jgi:peptidoglycan/xylan/chitin deacetylase (PgdA/CDA1 family)
MAYLHRFRKAMSLRDFVRGATGGTLPTNAVAVTFDDGYLDNLVTAKPILHEFEIPATLFLATGSIGQIEEFWWDELAKVFLERPEPTLLSIAIGGRSYQWRAAAATDRLAGAYQNNLKAYFELWTILRDLDAVGRDRIMDTLRQQAGVIVRQPLDRAMVESEVHRWLSGGLTDIAGHTVTHPRLRSLAEEERHQEISKSLARCEAITAGAGDGFAYPYGDRDHSVASAAAKAGARWACSTRRSLLHTSVDIDLFDLPRLQIVNGNLAKQIRGP